VLILNRAGIDIMIREGRVLPGSEVTLASSATAIAVKAGAIRPDISTPEALKRTLLAARAISYTDPAAGGASGILFRQAAGTPGNRRRDQCQDEVSAASRSLRRFPLTGEADLAIQQKPELLQVPGIDIVGMLPGDLHMVTVFVAGVEGVERRGCDGESADRLSSLPNRQRKSSVQRD
jgi:molybdate transport system substrate-binding protein